MSPFAKRLCLGLAIIVVSLQFARPVRNASETPAGPEEITRLHPTPPAVQAILARACYDCHSDRTRYPWYAHVQPIGWLLSHHVRSGKRYLNFSRFGSYPAERAAHKLDALIEAVQAREMPLRAYTWVHRDANLTDAEIAELVTWAKSIGSPLPAP